MAPCFGSSKALWGASGRCATSADPTADTPEGALSAQALGYSALWSASGWAEVTAWSRLAAWCRKIGRRSAFCGAGVSWHDGRDGRSWSPLAEHRRDAITARLITARARFCHFSITTVNFGAKIRSSGVPGISRPLRMEGGGDHGGRSRGLGGGLAGCLGWTVGRVQSTGDRWPRWMLRQSGSRSGTWLEQF